ncbi:hypothetical protein HCU64_06375 [Methylobacterium sp. C25]|uniref:hypothetical protein n=1 Tax=Methylobacterium sp. C25 TaxID=2721622 RepID=UPI001F35AFD3|nr:hypothetical protein [Methylobacterium sp. C25]MCE4223371.1 hypothetical protein [Methylobacterium sp. C25]
MAEPLTTWEMQDRLIKTLGVLEVDRRVHRVCRYLRQDRECLRCPMRFIDHIDGEEEVCQQACYGLALEAITYANGAVHPREKRPDAGAHHG